jgi:hypothetical protein
MIFNKKRKFFNYKNNLNSQKEFKKFIKILFYFIKNKII